MLVVSLIFFKSFCVMDEIPFNRMRYHKEIKNIINIITTIDTTTLKYHIHHHEHHNQLDSPPHRHLLPPLLFLSHHQVKSFSQFKNDFANVDTFYVSLTDTGLPFRPPHPIPNGGLVTPRAEASAGGGGRRRSLSEDDDKRGLR